MSKDLFRGELVRLVAEDADVVAEAIHRWSPDSEYHRLFDSDACRLWSKNRIQAWVEKDLLAERPDVYTFMIRTLEDDRLIGLVGMDGIQISNGDAFVGIGLGEREYWGKGYGTEAMRLMLRFAFHELNLRRVTLDVFEYNPRAVRSYEKAGFVIEGRMRGMLLREGKRWDLLYMGILREDWERMNEEAR